MNRFKLVTPEGEVRHGLPTAEFRVKHMRNADRLEGMLAGFKMIKDAGCGSTILDFLIETVEERLKRMK